MSRSRKIEPYNALVHKALEAAVAELDERDEAPAREPSREAERAGGAAHGHGNDNGNAVRLSLIFPRERPESSEATYERLTGHRPYRAKRADIPM